MRYCPGCDGTKGCHNSCGGPGPFGGEGSGGNAQKSVQKDSPAPDTENLLTLPSVADKEIVSELMKSGKVRIEKIVSTGQKSIDGFWYDQDENEWVCVLEGKGIIGYNDGSSVTLNKGDWLNIPARTMHRVLHTDNPTVWLAVFY